MHETSHAHDSAHRVRRLHEPDPVHLTLQSPAGHWISSPHAFVPLHWTSHELALLQNTWCMQEPSPQTTRHGRLTGQVTSIRQLFCALQSMTQTPFSHVPFVQPCWQRCCAVSSASGVG